jgi:tetratricopeptide (TPR) repeat protein
MKQLFAKPVFVCLMLLPVINLFAQQEKAYIRKGNKQYEAGRYTDAESFYKNALDEKASSFEGSFNLGDAAYKQEKYDDAINQFDLISKQANTKEQLGASYHNLGNAYLQKKEYEKSVEAYKQALRNTPSDMDTKYNLAYAQGQLKKQQQQQQQEDKDKDKNENEEKKDQDQKEDQDKKDDQQKKQDQKENEEQEKKDSKNEDQNKEEENKGQQQQQPRPDQLSKEEARKILEALKEKEMNVQDKLQKKKLKSTKMKSDKDW